MTENIKNSKKDMSDLENRIKTSILLHALGDTIGYYNGNWEFNYGHKKAGPSMCYELLSEYISKGGTTSINLKNWNVSDDTILHLLLGEAIIHSNNIDTLIETFKHYMIDNIELLEERDAGINTLNKIKFMKKSPGKPLNVDNNSGGSGASMRTPVIGLYFREKEDINKLIHIAIDTSVITHGHPTGLLGGVSVALFTYYAINKIPINKWGFKMIQYIESDNFNNLLKSKNKQYYKYYNDYKYPFINNWKKYLEDKFDKKQKIKLVNLSIIERTIYYKNNFAWKPTSSNQLIDFIGGSGDDSLIIAYDCLLDSQDNYEKLIIYSMLHMGDTDTTGCIASALYGAYYGDYKLPKNIQFNINNNLEYHKELLKLATNIFLRKDFTKKYKKLNK